MSIHDKFWLDDIKILYKRERLTEFFPTPAMSLGEKMNSLVRMSWYLAIILILINRKTVYLYIPLIMMGFTVAVYKINKKKIKESYTSETVKKSKKVEPCVEPTVNNPFMNINLITDKRDREPGCLSFDKPKLQEKIEDKFNFNLYRDVSDLYAKNNSQREFYTTPSTTIPNDQTSFAKWCYNTGPTCKEDTIKCAPFTASNMYSQQLNAANFSTLGSSL